MADEKKRGFFSWLGFGQKDLVKEKEAEQAAETQPPHTQEESETFAEEVVEVTEKLVESEKPQPVEEEPQPEVVAREELPLPEEVSEPESAAQEWQPEQEPVDEDAPISDEELEAQALAADAAEEALVVVPVDEPAEEVVEETVVEQEKPTKEGFFARLKRSLLKTKENLGSGFISLFRGKKIDDDLFE